jgi:tripartite-type tricarboxylate transporter receptor subunit TctC
MLSRRTLVASLALMPFVGPVTAADWPQRPVRIVFPYAAGSTGDATARLFARWLGDALGQPFIVENRVAANGIVGTEAVARSAPDGYTLLWAVTPQIAISPAMTKVPYDPIKDFVPISAISTNRFALIVNAKMPVQTVAEFVDYVRARRNDFAYAEGGAGSITHLAMVLFLHRAGLTATNVSYKGTAPALTDVVAGHLPTMFSLFGDGLSQMESGFVRMLAVSSAQRSAQAPKVPTIAESGFPGFAITSWWGLLAPAGTPKPIIDRIAAGIAQATKDPKILTQLTNFGVDPVDSSPAEFAAMISSDIALWANAVRLAGLQAP